MWVAAAEAGERSPRRESSAEGASRFAVSLSRPQWPNQTRGRLSCLATVRGSHCWVRLPGVWPPPQSRTYPCECGMAAEHVLRQLAFSKAFLEGAFNPPRELRLLNILSHWVPLRRVII